MKTLALIFTTGLGILTGTLAAAEPKPLVQLSARKQVLDTERDRFGNAGSSSEKTYTLRVEIYNTSSKPVEESVLTGNALVSRVREFKEQIVKESLGEIKVPAMKPNEKITLDLGEIELKEVEWGKRKFEENLEEWKVTCSQGDVEIGSVLSSDEYVVVVKEAVGADSKKPDPAIRGRLRFPNR